MARLVQKASALDEEPSKGSGAEPRSLAGGFTEVDMVAGGEGRAGGFRAGGLFDEEAGFCTGAVF